MYAGAQICNMLGKPKTVYMVDGATIEGVEHIDVVEDHRFGLTAIVVHTSECMTLVPWERVRCVDTEKRKVVE